MGNWCIFIQFSTKHWKKHSWVKGIRVSPKPWDIKHGTKHPRGKGIQIYANKGSCPFPRGDSNSIGKIHQLTKFKNLFIPKPLGQFQTNLVDTKHPCVIGTQAFIN